MISLRPPRCLASRGLVQVPHGLQGWAETSFWSQVGTFGEGVEFPQSPPGRLKILGLRCVVISIPAAPSVVLALTPRQV